MSAAEQTEPSEAAREVVKKLRLTASVMSCDPYVKITLVSTEGELEDIIDRALRRERNAVREADAARLSEAASVMPNNTYRRTLEVYAHQIRSAIEPDTAGEKSK
jgi:hypothetical protein